MTDRDKAQERLNEALEAVKNRLDKLFGEDDGIYGIQEGSSLKKEDDDSK